MRISAAPASLMRPASCSASSCRPDHYEPSLEQVERRQRAGYSRNRMAIKDVLGGLKLVPRDKEHWQIGIAVLYGIRVVEDAGVSFLAQRCAIGAPLTVGWHFG